MLENDLTIPEHWAKADAQIKQWLVQRQLLIQLLCAISDPNMAPEDSTPDIRIEAFLNQLMDYMSTSHFEIYQQLIRETSDFGDEVAAKEMESRLPKLEKITQTALTFNDQFEELKSNPPSDWLAATKASISSLGAKLEDFFANEDKLLELMHEAHRPTPSR